MPGGGSAARGSAARTDASLVPSTVSFTSDIFPILKRVCDLAWVNASARAGHGQGGAQHFLDPDRLRDLYRVPVMATLGRFPKARESDSTWRTKEVRHVGSDTVTP